MRRWAELMTQAGPSGHVPKKQKRVNMFDEFRWISVVALAVIWFFCQTSVWVFETIQMYHPFSVWNYWNVVQSLAHSVNCIFDWNLCKLVLILAECFDSNLWKLIVWVHTDQSECFDLISTNIFDWKKTLKMFGLNVNRCISDQH